jgi:pimeloyl-ACP methyl ester carboxylesterase
MKKLVFVLAACAMFAASCAHEDSTPSDQLINLGTHSLEIHREGTRTPAVVIDTGIGDQMDRLRSLQQRIALVTQVIAYNRAGYGRSEAGPLPRDCGREADELKALLEKASIPGPYVLVGHSLGALIVQMFASRYPADVAGMVLLDPPPLSFILGQDYGNLSAMADRMTEEWQAAADSMAQSADPRARARANFLRMIASEHREMFDETARMVGAISTFGDIPLVVVASGKPNPAFGSVAEKFQTYWIEQSRSLADKSTRGRFVLADGSSHYLYEDVPELVAENILSLVHDVREK